jgi:hypothetical protein
MFTLEIACQADVGAEIWGRGIWWQTVCSADFIEEKLGDRFVECSPKLRHEKW